MEGDRLRLSVYIEYENNVFKRRKVIEKNVYRYCKMVVMGFRIVYLQMFRGIRIGWE